MYNDCQAFKDERLEDDRKYFEEKYEIELPGIDVVQFRCAMKKVIYDDDNNIERREIDTDNFERILNHHAYKDHKKWYNFLDPNHPSRGVIVVNANVSSLEMLYNFIEMLGSKFVLIVDEVDKVYSDSSDTGRKMDKFLTKIIKRSANIVGTTATPMKIFMDRNSGLTNVTKIPVNPKYVGINDIGWDTKIFKTSQAVPEKVSVFNPKKGLPQLKEFIEHESKAQPIKVQLKEQTYIIPNIVGLSPSVFQRHQSEIHSHI